MATKTLDRRKIELIVQITNLDNEEAVRQVENFVGFLNQQPTAEQLEMIKKVAKPIRKKLNVADLIREQNWKPIDREEFDSLIKEIDIQEPLEQLLADI